MKKTSKLNISQICIFSAAMVLVLLCGAAAMVRLAPAKEVLAAGDPTGAPVSAQPETVSLTEAQIDVISLNEVTPEPVATATPALPDSAVDVVVNGVPVVSVASQKQAEALLSEYLDMMAVAGENEYFLSASYQCDIRFARASGQAPFYDFDTAFALLFSEPGLAPVTVVTQVREFHRGSAPFSNENLDTLAKGTRLITQLGSGALSVDRSERVYVADELSSSTEPASQVLLEARTTLVRTGTFKESAKGDDAGKAWAQLGSLTLSYPLRGTLIQYFGMTDAGMSDGINIHANAGSKVKSPGEGIVVYCAQRGEYGFVVDIDHGNGFLSRLTHLSEVPVELNQRVFAGDALGVVASRDDGERPYLHYELHVGAIPVNPLMYLR